MTTKENWPKFFVTKYEDFINNTGYTLSRDYTKGS